ncbi:hypothetical protein, partial [Kyrpidia sp.]|uniref:hypothetical protein n=1 Tax=Kyrpidia sp. TaxID=2073077 RepID=UPI0025895F85
IGSGQGEYQQFAETVPVFKNGHFWAYGNVYDNGQWKGHTFVNGQWINNNQDAIVTYLNRQGWGEVVRVDLIDRKPQPPSSRDGGSRRGSGGGGSGLSQPWEV